MVVGKPCVVSVELCTASVRCVQCFGLIDEGDVVVVAMSLSSQTCKHLQLRELSIFWRCSAPVGVCARCTGAMRTSSNHVFFKLAGIRVVVVCVG